jgi:hypothetical protein
VDNFEYSVAGGAFRTGRIMYRYQHTVDGDGCFDPETVIILSAAYDEAWRSLQNSGIYFTCREAEAARERLAQRIIENAKGGERDPGRLRDDALRDLTRSSGSQFKRRASRACKSGTRASDVPASSAV